MTYAIRYATWLYPGLQFGYMPIASSSLLQSSPLGSGKPGIAPAGCNLCYNIPLQVALMCIATLSASKPIGVVLDIAAPCDTVASAYPFWSVS